MLQWIHLGRVPVTYFLLFNNFTVVLTTAYIFYNFSLMPYTGWSREDGRFLNGCYSALGKGTYVRQTSFAPWCWSHDVVNDTSALVGLRKLWKMMDLSQQFRVSFIATSNSPKSTTCKTVLRWFHALRTRSKLMNRRPVWPPRTVRSPENVEHVR